MKYQMPLFFAVMAITLIYELGRKSRAEKKLCVQCVTVVLTLFSGLRTWWYADLIKYYTLYTRCVGENWRDAVYEKPANIGIRFFFHYAGKLHISYDMCLFIIAAFIAISLGILIFRYSHSPYLSYLMYIGMGFYMFTFSGLKQAIGMGFLCFAMICLLENKWKGWIIWTAIAGVFHAPALIFMLAYPFSRKKFDRFYFIFIAISAVLVFVFRNQIATFLGELYYDEQDTWEASKTVGGRFLMMAFILVLALFLRPLQRDDRQYVYVFNTMVVAALIQSFSVYDNNFTRLADYYYQFIVLFIPLIMEDGRVQRLKNPERRRIVSYGHNVYTLLGIGITVFALWYYSQYSQSVGAFMFRWEIDPYALYGT